MCRYTRPLWGDEPEPRKPGTTYWAVIGGREAWAGEPVCTLLPDAFHYKPKVVTLADTLKRERTVRASIERDPFKHLNAQQRGVGWSRTDWLANGPTPWLDEYRAKQDKRKRAAERASKPRKARRVVARSARLEAPPRATPRLGAWMRTFA